MTGARLKLKLKRSHTGSSSKKRKMTGASTTTSCSLVNQEWDSLPLTAGFLILDKLLEPADHIRFGAICKHYQFLHFLVKDYHQAKQHTRQLNKDLLPPPLLLIRNKEALVTLCSVSEGKVYSNVEFPELPPSNNWCYSCGHGWLATMDERTNQGMTISLRKPFRKPSTTIRLPLSKYQSYGVIGKVMLSADPALNPDTYVIGVTYGCRGLAFISARKQHWTYLQQKYDYSEDAIFYKNQIYAVGVGTRREIVSVKINSNSNNVPEAKLLTPVETFLKGSRRYLVELTKGDLLYIERMVRSSMINALWDPKIEGFGVYKVVFCDGDGSAVEKLLETTSIGDEALFVDDNHAVTVSASNFPKCQRNSIYCTTNRYLKSPSGMSTFVFNLEDGTVKLHPYPLNTMQRDALQTHWIAPSFTGLL